MRLRSLRALVVSGVVAAAATAWLAAGQRDAGAPVPPPAFDEAGSGRTATAVLAGGCFWGVQAVFEHVNGVSRVLAGYSGGSLANPTYEDVTTETTGHAESVQITFDPAKVSYGQLLQVFFSVAHDPTELNRQGPDEGPSYRSDIFYVDDSQKRVAQAYIDQLNKAHAFHKPIATRVDAFAAFYPAERYHQDFLITHPSYPYIVINDLPKLSALKRVLPTLYREQAARVPGGPADVASR